MGIEVVIEQLKAKPAHDDLKTNQKFRDDQQNPYLKKSALSMGLLLAIKTK